MTSSPISRWSAEELREFHADLVRGVFLDPDPRHVPGIEYDEPPRRVSAGWVVGVILVMLVVGVVAVLVKR